MEELFPIMRSITGPGVRDSLKILQTIAPLTVHEVASGTAVLDWTVPEEWKFNEAWIENDTGRRILDCKASNLHVVNFSIPVDRTISRKELLPHLHSIKERPSTVPYRTNYYSEQWGFCLSYNDLQKLGAGPFHVYIDASRQPGVLNYGELYIPGESQKEILVSTHICHPQLANDNLSGMVLAASLAAFLQGSRPALSWRFIFVPGTIGSITWLSLNPQVTTSIVGGLVLTGLGDNSDFNWKSTLDADRWIDSLVQQVLSECVPDQHTILPFTPYGYDERQYCSPGFKLPVGRLTRAVHGTFSEYHSSDDNMSFVNADKIQESLTLLQRIATAANNDVIYRNLSPFAEPQLGKRDLYSMLGANTDPGSFQMALLWLLNQSDGKKSLSRIAKRSGISMPELHDAAQILVQHNLLKPVRHASEEYELSDH